jgi:hypothetical protein
MRVDLVSSASGDWIAVYVDGDKVAEGHSLSEGMVLDAVGIQHGRRELSDKEIDELGSHFPDSVFDLPDAP